MERFFLELFNRAICAGWLVTAILILRVVLKKVPKWMRCLLWGMVAVRLLVPLQIESRVSLIPSAQTVSPDIMYAAKPEIHTGIGVMNATFNPVISDHLTPEPENSVNPVQVIVQIAAWVWLAGAVLMLFWAAVSYLRLRFLVRAAVPVRAQSPEEKNAALPAEIPQDSRTLEAKVPVLESERVESPFVIGLFRPRIYLPVKLKEADRDFIISHEAAHIHRKDHWIKPFGYLLLAVYWFHPLMWAAYIMLCRDIEYACDERVVKQYDVEERKAYSTALLACSVRRMRIAACPVAFGEVGVRQRVKSVLHYKKPAFWVLIAAAVGCAVVAVCFLTNPKEKNEQPETDGVTQGTGTQGEGGSGTGGSLNAENGADGRTENADGSVGGASDTGGGNGQTMQDGGGDMAGTTGPDIADSAEGVEIPADGSYLFERCVYMNPLSSYFPQKDAQISGTLDADGLIWNEHGNLKRIEWQKAPDSANADTLPWSVFEAEELKELVYSEWGYSQEEEAVFEYVDPEIDRIVELPPAKRLWRPLVDGHRLLYVDGELWFMKLAGGSDGVWSIYALRPQGDVLTEAIGKAVWDWAEETNVFDGVKRTHPAAEGVTGELWAWYPCVSYRVLATEGAVDAADETLKVYAHVYAAAYLCEQTGITDVGGSYIPAVMTFLVEEDGSYTLSEYWTPRDGSYFAQDIREKCPDPVADAMLDGQKYIDALIRESYEKAISETGVVDSFSVVAELFDRMLLDRDGLLDAEAGAAERMAVYPLTVRELSYYGEDTLRYIYAQFMRGGESGLKGELMARVMNELIGGEIQLRMPLTDGQAYFDALCECARASYEDLIISQGGEAQAEEYMREYMPAQRLLLWMLYLRTSDAEAEAREEYEYYLTREELLADIDEGGIFRLDTTFCRERGESGGYSYPAPFVRLGTWPFYVHEENVVDLEIAYSNLRPKQKETVFPMEERIMVDVISPDGRSVYRFEKTGEEIIADTSIKERISVSPGEWTLQISFAYVCGEQPAHLRIAAFYEEPTMEDKDWLVVERLTNAGGA